MSDRSLDLVALFSTLQGFSEQSPLFQASIKDPMFSIYPKEDLCSAQESAYKLTLQRWEESQADLEAAKKRKGGIQAEALGDMEHRIHEHELAAERALERYEKARKSAVHVHERKLTEMNALLAQLKAWVPVADVQRLKLGALVIGPTPSLTVVTPGQLFQAVLLKKKSRPEVSISNAVGAFETAAKVLTTIGSGAPAVWSTLLVNIQKLHADYEGTLAALSPALIGQILLWALLAGGDQRGALIRAFGEAWAPGVIAGDTRTMADLFAALQSPGIHEALANLSVAAGSAKSTPPPTPPTLPKHGQAKKAEVMPPSALSTSKVDELVPGKVAPRGRAPCYAFANTGACERGEHCRFAH